MALATGVEAPSNAIAQLPQLDDRSPPRFGRLTLWLMVGIVGFADDLPSRLSRSASARGCRPPTRRCSPRSPGTPQVAAAFSSPPSRRAARCCCSPPPPPPIWPARECSRRWRCSAGMGEGLVPQPLRADQPVPDSRVGHRRRARCSGDPGRREEAASSTWSPSTRWPCSRASWRRRSAARASPIADRRRGALALNLGGAVAGRGIVLAINATGSTARSRCSAPAPWRSLSVAGLGRAGPARRCGREPR